MPTYDYRCEETGDVYEVAHPMSLAISNWGELCQAGRLDPGRPSRGLARHQVAAYGRRGEARRAQKPGGTAQPDNPLGSLAAMFDFDKDGEVLDGIMGIANRHL